MEWLEKMNSAVDYIEANLSGEIDYQTAAAKACCSSYNFQRMFSFITDIPLAEYIRRRKLTQAALDLHGSDAKIIDVALRYGYESAASFSRAFRALHGISPREARAQGAQLKAYPRLSFQITVKGASEMKYRIETKEAFDVFGVETVASLSGEPGYQSPAELWQNSHKSGVYEDLFEKSGSLPGFVAPDLCRIHGAEYYRKTEEGTFPYMLCAFVSPDSRTEGYQIAHIPAQTYVILPSEPFDWGADFSAVLEGLHKKFYSEWLPTSNYSRAEGPNFEIYGGTAEKGYIELWYPIVRK